MIEDRAVENSSERGGEGEAKSKSVLMSSEKNGFLSARVKKKSNQEKKHS